MCTREDIEIAAQVAIAAGFILNAGVFYLQRRSLQADLFKVLMSRLYELSDRKDEKAGGGKFRNWSMEWLNTFEYCAFCVNHGYLSSEMTSFLKQSCDVDSKEIAKGVHSSFIERLESRPSGTYTEIEKWIGKSLVSFLTDLKAEADKEKE